MEWIVNDSECRWYLFCLLMFVGAALAITTGKLLDHVCNWDEENDDDFFVL